MLFSGAATKLIHCGNEPSNEFRGVSVPLDFSTTYAQPAPGQPVVFDYTRCGNPTRIQLERQLASMEHGKFAFACASGIAACTTVMNLCQKGDHILCVDDVYGGTQRYLRMILGPNTGIEINFNDFSNIQKFKTMVKPNTRLVWLETPTNPTLKVFDIQAIAKAVKEVNKNCLLIIDNTFATAINTNPLLLGADIVTHSMTKYIGGHSDMLGGCLILNDRALYDKLFFILKSTGTGLASFDCWLTLRSLKTLEVRVQKAQSNATAIAKALEAHPKCVKVVYPGLKSHAQYAIAKKQMRGPGGMVSFYVKGGIKNATNFLKALKWFTLAESLGGVESLAEAPSVMTHGSVPPAVRKELGIEDNFIRLSVGIESEEDLVNDIK